MRIPKLWAAAIAMCMACSVIAQEVEGVEGTGAVSAESGNDDTANEKTSAPALDTSLIEEAVQAAYIEDKSPVDVAERSTAQELRGTGRRLYAEAMTSTGQSEDAEANTARGKYLAVRLRRADALRSADVIYVGSNASVTTTRCLFLIIGGYLEAAAGLPSDEAYQAAERICWWNSAHYGDAEYFVHLFGDDVLSTFGRRTSAIGLSSVYKDWPGKTRIVVPFVQAAANADAGSDGQAAVLDEALLAESATDKASSRMELEEAEYVPRDVNGGTTLTLSGSHNVPSGLMLLLGTVCLGIVTLVFLLIKVIMDLAHDRGA